MNIAPTFSVGIGSTSVQEHLPTLRKLFTDCQGELQIVYEGGQGMLTSLGDYFSGDPQTNHLDTNAGLEPLRAAIEDAARVYAAGCGYAADKYTVEVANFWLNEMTAGQMHKPHNHYGYNFSGCIYVDMPKDAPGIRFDSFKGRYDTRKLDIAQYTIFNSAAWDFQPTEGQLFIWESWLQHQVIPSQYEGVRRTAAFDVVMKRIPQ
jgi:uncharacterized protein (TIGR02466 family)